MKTKLALIYVGMIAVSGNCLSQEQTFEVPFGAADVVFDPVRPYVYVSGYANKTLVMVNLTNGVVERQFNFDWYAESIAVSSDGQKMYVALLRRNHSPYWFGGHTNYIAEFDLANRVKTSEFTVLADPGDLVVTDGGVLIMTGGSDQWTDIQTYRATTGQLLGTSGIRQMSHITLHPSQTAVYAADTDSSPSDIRRYNFDPVTGVFLSTWDSPYHGDHPMSGNVWCHPNGTNLIVGGGGVFSSSAVQEQDMRYLRTLAGGVVEGASFDPAHQALFTVGGDSYYFSSTNYLRWYNLLTYELVSSQIVSNGTRYLHVSGPYIHLAAVSGNRTVFQRWANPAVGAETNQPPVATFARTPTNATTLTTITFDATSSTDDQGGGTALQYQWDWENNGEFDTTFTNHPVAAHRYNIAGTKTAAVQVKDRYGLVSKVTQTFDVVQENDPGTPGGGNPAFEVQFVAADVVFDPVRPYAYVSGYSNKTLVMVNLTNGVVERQFNFDWHAESIAVSSDGHKMYVALLKRPHSYYWFGGHANYIAEFDLNQRVKLKEFEILADPYDLAVTDGGILVVPGGSDQWTDIRTYRAATGQLLGTSGIRQMSHITLHPSQTAVYAADTDSSPSDIRRYNFDPVSGVFGSTWDSPYHGDHPMSGNVWCHPNGTNLIVGGGGVFSSSAVQAQDMRYLRALAGGVVEGASFDPVHQALFTVEGDSYYFSSTNYLRWYNLQTYELVSNQIVSNGTRYLHVSGPYIHLAAVSGNRTVFQRLANPAVGAETNQPPVAAFARTPTNATTLTTITFDATSSTDDQGGGTALQYQWDWENNGEFDTTFTNQPVAAHRYNIAGTKTAAVQVKDRYGLVSKVTQTFDVVQENDPGTPGGGNPAFEVQFVAADVVFDPVRPYAYVSGYSNKTLVMVNLTNGVVERQFNFDWHAESIAVSSDGHKMYVALLKRPHSYYWFGGHANYIAEFDLNQRVKLKEFEILADPYDLAVTDGGILVVPGGSDQWTDIRTYRAATGQLLGTSGIRQMSHITLHPSQTAVYAADTDSSPSDIRRYNFDPVSGVFGSTWDSPYHGDHPMSGNVWCHPNGTNLIVGGGGVFSSSAVQAQDMRYLRALAGGVVEGASFDPVHQALFTVEGDSYYFSSTNYLRWYNLQTYELVSNQIVSNGTRYLHVSGPYIHLAAVSGNRTVFQRWANPAVGAETNQPPVAAFARTPTNATTLTTITFDATSSTDDQGGGTALQYQWDWENNGEFDTTFTNHPVAAHRYNIAGTKTAAVQVKDRYGLVSKVTQTFDVVQENDPGTPGGGNPAFEVQFVAADVVFDPLRPYAYVSGYSNKTLVMVNLTNGVVERQFNFDWHAESIAVSSDGHKMYVALLKRPHSYYWFGGHANYIAEFDLNQRVKLKEFEILADPYDLAVTDGGILVVPGGSDQWTDIRTYRAATGQLLGTSGIRQMSHITLHPSQTAVYAADTDSSPSDIRRYNFDPVSGVFGSTWDSPYHGDHPMSGNVWCHPNGTNLIVGGGGVFSSSAVQAQDMRYLRALAGGVVEGASFDPVHQALFTVEGDSYYFSSTNYLRWYNLQTYELVSSQIVSNGTRYLHVSGPYIHLAAVSGNRTVFQRLANPAVRSETNHPPLADASATRLMIISPNRTNATVSLDGSRSSDPDDDPLQYTWYESEMLLAIGKWVMTDLPVGSHFIQLTVNDGRLASTNAILVEILTLSEAVEALIARVNASALPERSVRPLLATLEAAAASFDRSSIVSGVNQLQAFQHKVSAQLARLDSAQANELWRAAQTIIDTAQEQREGVRVHTATKPSRGKFKMRFSAASEAVYWVETTTNLLDWSPLGVASELGSRTYEFEDEGSDKLPVRFYRVISR